MSIKEEKTCSLCYNVADNDFVVIDRYIKTMFDLLLLKTSLNLSENPESTCIETEGLAFAVTVVKKEVDINDTQEGKTNVDAIVNSFNECRFCKNKGDDLVALDALLNDATFAEMLREFLPEMDFTVTGSPLVCVSCRNNLECYFKFAESVSQVKNMFEGKLRNTYHLTVNDTSVCTESSTRILTVKQEADALQAMGSTQSAGCDNVIKLEEILDIKNEEIKCDENMAERSSEVIVKGDFYHKYDDSNNDNNSSQKTFNSNDNKPKDNLNVDVETYKCSLCSYETKGKYCLKTHLISHKDPSELETFKCAICAYKTKYKSNLKNHILIHKNAVEVQIYKCSLCTYETKFKGTLRRHSVIHKNSVEIAMYKCMSCAYEAKLKHHLKRHLLTHADNSEITMHKCTKCPYESKLKDNLRKHMITHKSASELKMYTCPFCTYESKHKKCVQIHILTHKNPSELTMYRCTICTHETKTAQYLKRHMKSHAESTPNPKMYKCRLCAFETRRKGYLKVHLLTHKDASKVETFKCALCSYETKLKRYLTRHILNHIKSEKYKTDKTKYRTQLQAHAVIHEDVPQVETYKCTECAFEAKIKRSLTRHMRSHRNAPKIEVC